MDDDYGETYEPDEAYPHVGEVRFLTFFDENDKVLKGGNFEFTEEGQWIEI